MGDAVGDFVIPYSRLISLLTRYFGNHAIEPRKGEHRLRRLLSDLLTGESRPRILERMGATLSSVRRTRTERRTEERTEEKTA